MIVNDPRRLGRSPSARRLRRAATCAAVALASAAGAAQAAEPGIPTEIQIEQGTKLYLEAHAVGVQIYTCAAGPDGARFAGTTWIQRVATVGGLPPAAADCNAVTAGTRKEIPYSADYRFWKADV